MSGGLSRGRNTSRLVRWTIPGLAATTFIGVLAGCSSSGGNPSNGSSPAGGQESAASASGKDGGVAQAQSFVAKYAAPMTTFNLPALTSTPPRGKKIAVIVNNVPESHDILVGAQDAARLLGWTTIPITYDPSKPTGLQDAFAQAVQDDPDGVVTQAADTSAYSQAAKEFAAKHIPVVTSNTSDEVRPPVVANVTDARQVAIAGRITADYVIAQKGTAANVAMFNVPSFSILKAYETAFKTEYLRVCPSCKYTSVPVQAADIGTKVPAQVVSTVQSNPKINYAVMGFGTVSLGVAGALRTAGITNVKIVGEAPAVGNIAALLNGTEDMWVAFPLRGIGWKSVDALARQFSNESAAVDTTAPMPFRILTKSNVSAPAALPEVANYQDYFKHLWKVG